jgi:hypothetical protein
MAVLQGTSVSTWSWERLVLTPKKGVNFETKLLEVRHMSRLEFFYVGLSNSTLKLVYLNVCVSPSYHAHIRASCCSLVDGGVPLDKEI